MYNIMNNQKVKYEDQTFIVYCLCRNCMNCLIETNYSKEIPNPEEKLVCDICVTSEKRIIKKFCSTILNDMLPNVLNNIIYNYI